MQSYCIPNVLLLGNGVLKLKGSPDWNEPLKKISKKDISLDLINDVPFAMKPEALCGTDTENIQARVANELEHWKQSIPIELEALLSLDFDCILTTNYTYEIEKVLCDKWTERKRNKARRCLHGSPYQHKNTHICYEVERKNKPPI